jgi:multidrug efflux pump subunit AcrB
VLITSTLVPFEQLGYVIVYAIAYSLVAAVLVLPSLLVLWDRRARRRPGDAADPPVTTTTDGAAAASSRV